MLKKWERIWIWPSPWGFLLFWPGDFISLGDVSVGPAGWKCLAIAERFPQYMGSEDSRWRKEGAAVNSKFSEPDDLNLGEINGVIYRQFTIPSEPCGSRVLSSCQLHTHVRNTNCEGREESQAASTLIILGHCSTAGWGRAVAPHALALSPPLFLSHSGRFSLLSHSGVRDRTFWGWTGSHYNFEWKTLICWIHSWRTRLEKVK